jgi:hypothetical protein
VNIILILNGFGLFAIDEKVLILMRKDNTYMFSQMKFENPSQFLLLIGQSIDVGSL